ncbi:MULTISPECIES: helix-turn-helix domain-containing protein [unclassified Pseudoalteromonas]|uniref:helix-turn-helix domain-containing protein n=1 Tax=unclassified Pseudoalteromonas TaxID=194690 RepID=UPI0020973325|nr:helix-turn-helix domain-containing protein [Pseudoalteromonas sp. XMcav2-N]MCO7189757.1 helix-turn-helix domain-containing protein [Pseudoalteromonas sp. XMcav2-N]
MTLNTGKPAPVRFALNQSVRVKHIAEQGVLFEWHQHDCFELILTLGARGRGFIGEAIHEFADIDLALIAPGVSHTWDCQVPYETAELVVVVLWPKALLGGRIPELAAIQHWLDGIESGLVFNRETAERVRESCLALHVASPLRRITLLCEILDELQASPAIGFQSGYSRNSERLASVQAFIANRVAEQPSLAECASHVNVSRATLKRWFQNELGCSFSQYCALQRRQRAQHLLATERRPISVVAQQCGFSSAAYFNQFFKTQTGMTPTAYRRQFSWRKR